MKKIEKIEEIPVDEMDWWEYPEFEGTAWQEHVKAISKEIFKIESKINELIDFMISNHQEECEHKWGEWQEIDREPGMIGGTLTQERKCTKCGYIEIKRVGY